MSTEPVFCIWDNVANKYVVRRLRGYGGQGRAPKYTWTSRGAAKSAGIIVIREDEFREAKAEGRKLYDARKKCRHFDDQKRYEVHEMKLARADGSPPGKRWFISSHDDRFWLVPEDNRANWNLWVSCCLINSELWEYPSFVKPVKDLEDLTFSEWAFK